MLDITIHQVEKVIIKNQLWDNFETIKLEVVNDKGESMELCLFSGNKRMPLEVVKAFTIDRSNSEIVKERE